jgi:hypothetical protein
MVAALYGAVFTTLSNATVVRCRERTSAVRAGIQDEGVVGFARLGGHYTPRIAPPSPPAPVAA